MNHTHIPGDRLRRVWAIIVDIYREPDILRRTLAQRYGISERQIQEDLRLVEDLGFPLYRQKGYRFLGSHPMPPVSFVVDEAIALFLALQQIVVQPGLKTGELTTALSKLCSLFPPALQPLLHEVLDAGDRGRPAGPRERILLELGHALAAHHSVWIRYETASRGDAESERLGDPYELLPHLRSWYLVAYCHLRGEIRMFKLDRIREVHPSQQIYAIPEDFDLDAYMGDTWGLLRGESGEPEEVRLRFSPRAGRWVREEHWHKTQEFQALPTGEVEMKLHIPLTPEFVRWLMYYGSDVAVLAPPALRDGVREEAKAVIAACKGLRVTG